jgi:TfoX/Sxy family transcriptional regulator of competence genes
MHNQVVTDAYLLERLRNCLQERKVHWLEKKMFGGNCFMVDDKMLMGTFKGGIMARIDPEELNELLKRDGVEIMINGGRPMHGYLFIDPLAYDSEEDLEFWVDRCLEFNPKAKSSKKK